MPDTAKDLKIVDVFDPEVNIFGGPWLLREHINEFGSLKRALIAYNADPDRDEVSTVLLTTAFDI